MCEGAPQLPLGADIAGGALGELLFVRATVRGRGGEAVAGATVNVWQADAQGLYDVQRDGLDQPQGRATLRTDGEGRLDFRSVMPVPYPIPVDGPVGTMLGALRRHPWRPAHVHFMIEAHGYQTLITHVFRAGDAYLDSDAVFGVRNSLIGDFRACPPDGQAPDGSRPAQPFHTLDFDFVLAREAIARRPPIRHGPAPHPTLVRRKEPPMAKVLVLYYSFYGHIEAMAYAVAEGARQVPGANVVG